MTEYVSPYGKDRVFLYDDLDEFRDAVKSYCEGLDDPEQQAYADGVIDAVGFLMVNHPKTFTREQAEQSRATVARLGDVLIAVAEYWESYEL